MSLSAQSLLGFDTRDTSLGVELEGSLPSTLTVSESSLSPKLSQHLQHRPLELATLSWLVAALLHCQTRGGSLIPTTILRRGPLAR